MKEQHKLPKKLVELMNNMAGLQQLEIPSKFFFSFFFVFTHLLPLVFSDVMVISSCHYRQQAWHLDSPLPNVFVNLLYLNRGQMTQFMVPAALPAVLLEGKPPMDEIFAPFGISDEDSKSEEGESCQPLLSKKWVKYLKER